MNGSLMDNKGGLNIGEVLINLEFYNVVLILNFLVYQSRVKVLVP